MPNFSTWAVGTKQTEARGLQTNSFWTVRFYFVNRFKYISYDITRLNSK